MEAGDVVTCTFTSEKWFTIITLVCHADQLYLSTVTLVGGGTEWTLEAWETATFNPCTMSAGRFDGMPTGLHELDVTIS